MIARLVLVLAVLVVLGAGATAANTTAWPSVFFLSADLTYGIEIDYAAWPGQALVLWQGDGQGAWWPTPLRYRLYFDHGWFTEWRAIGGTDAVYLVFVSRNICALYHPGLAWWSDPLRRLEPDQ